MSMIYVVTVLRDDQVVYQDKNVKGMVEVDKILAVYPEESGYEVDFYPDALRYMEVKNSAN